MHYIGKFLHKALLGFLGILLLLCFLFAAMQTKGFKKLIKERLIAEAHHLGLVLTIGSIEGQLPFQWTLHDVHFELDQRNTLDVKRANLRIAFFPLLRKEIAISYLSLHETFLLFSEDIHSIPPLSFPFSLSLRSLRAENIHVEKFETKQTGIFSFRGKGMLKKYISSFLTELKLSSEASPNSFVVLYLRLKDMQVDALAQIQSKSPQAFCPFFTLPFGMDGALEGTLTGRWTTWQSLFNGTPEKSLPPLQGTLHGNLDRLEIPHLKIANRKWKLDSSFQLFSSKELNFNSLSLESNLFTLEALAQFDNTGTIKQAHADFSFPQLTLFSIYLPTSITGTLAGEMTITDHSALFEMHGDQMTIGGQNYSQFSALIKAKKEKGEWLGRAEFLADNPFLPIIGQSDFSIDSQKQITIEDCLITAPESKIAGNLFIDLPHKTIEGSLFGQILSLRPYRIWATGYSGLEGNIGAQVTFHGESLKGHFLVKNLHYFNTFLNELTCDFSLANFSNPLQAHLSLEGDQLYSPPFYFSRYGFETQWDGKTGPYSLYAKGEWKEPLEIQTAGYWTKDSVHIETLQGMLLKEDFFLEKPFAISTFSNHINVSQCDLRLGKGHLSTALNLNKNHSTGYLKAEHFPLDLLFISQPSFSLGGSTNMEASMEGSEDHLQGHVHLLLEELDLYQSGKTSPLQAKGTLDIQLKDKILEVAGDLAATDEQFVKGRALLPINYHLFPLEVWFNHHRPISGEMHFQGKMEELFDFMNMGSHRISGLVCSQLEISETLENPHLKGYLDLHQATYENYYTGTHLKNIDAQCVATGDQIALKSFQANDDQGGEAKATGELEISFENKFPYKANVHLNNLNLLKFDRVHSNFTGPLMISGNSESALAQGALTVTKADLTIPDALPPDVPVIPVTYINRPPHLDAYTLQPLPLFPFILDLDLTAPGPIYLRGKGLRSEWQGKALLSGTNAHIAASGSLSLMKGEFVFSGKTFTLSQGEINFIDQGTQHAYINLKGELQLPELTITAILNGPLSAPILTFQSTPYLPTSSILSHILFNKDINDITAFQALQVAQTIVTLSGGAGPDVLEKIRKSIGVDRLNIISSSQNPDEVALQIGKYLTKGVMVTLAQGFNTSQIIVEVELKYGFLLQAETQEVEEGKFSLKWNRNY